MELLEDNTEETPVGVPAAEEPNRLLSEPEMGPLGGGRFVGGPRPAANVFVFMTVALDMLALGMIAPVLPHLIGSFLAGDASRTANMLGLFGTVFAGMQFFFSPVLGSLSDRFGRRPIILLSNFGLGLDYMLMAWAPVLSWLLVGRIISGLTASSVPTAMAYMADVTPREKRAAAFGMLNAAFGIGFVIGPAVGGLLGNYNARLPFWVAGGLSLLNGMYGLFVLPESLTPAMRTPFSWKRANPIGSVKLLHKNGTVIALSCLLLLGYLAQTSLMNVYVVSSQYRFGWTTRTIGLSLAMVGIFQGIYGALLVKPLLTKWGERRAILFGLIGGASGYFMFGWTKTGMLIWLGIPVLNLMAVAWPAAQSIMSRAAGAGEQGQLQGAINSLRGLAGLIGPYLFTAVFVRSIAPRAMLPYAGMPFFLASALVAAATLLAVRATRPEEAAA